MYWSYCGEQSLSETQTLFSVEKEPAPYTQPIIRVWHVDCQRGVLKARKWKS